MSIEALLERIAVGLEANTASVDKLVAGREAALAQLEKTVGSGEAAPKATRSRSKKADEPAAGAATGTAEAGSGDPAVASQGTAPTAPTATDDELRAAASDYIKGAGEDGAAKQARGQNLKAIVEHFGTTALAGPTGIQDGEQRAQAVFYIKRFDAGCTVDFGQDYDFSGDPTQGGLDAVEPAAADDEFNIG